MTKLNERQEKFAQNVAKGLSKTQAAIEAGYSPKNAGRAGIMMSGKNHPKIQARIEELQKRAANKMVHILRQFLLRLQEVKQQGCM